MKKQFSILAVVLAAMFVFTGCHPDDDHYYPVGSQLSAGGEEVETTQALALTRVDIFDADEGETVRTGTVDLDYGTDAKGFFIKGSYTACGYEIRKAFEAEDEILADVVEKRFDEVATVYLNADGLPSEILIDLSGIKEDTQEPKHFQPPLEYLADRYRLEFTYDEYGNPEILVLYNYMTEIDFWSESFLLWIENDYEGTRLVKKTGYMIYSDIIATFTEPIFMCEIEYDSTAEKDIVVQRYYSSDYNQIQTGENSTKGVYGWKEDSRIILVYEDSKLFEATIFSLDNELKHEQVNINGYIYRVHFLDEHGKWIEEEGFPLVILEESTRIDHIYNDDTGIREFTILWEFEEAVSCAKGEDPSPVAEELIRYLYDDVTGKLVKVECFDLAMKDPAPVPAQAKQPADLILPSPELDDYEIEKLASMAFLTWEMREIPLSLVDMDMVDTLFYLADFYSLPGLETVYDWF